MITEKTFYSSIYLTGKIHSRNIIVTGLEGMLPQAKYIL